MVNIWADKNAELQFSKKGYIWDVMVHCRLSFPKLALYGF